MLFSTLRNKIIILSFFLIFFLQISSGIVQYYQTKQTLFGGMADRASNSSLEFINSLNKRLSGLTTDEQKGGFVEVFVGLEGKTMLNQILNNVTDLDRIDFFNKDGRILISEDRKGTNGNMPVVTDQSIKNLLLNNKNSTFENDDQFIISIPVIYKNNLVGYLVFYYSNQEFGNRESALVYNTIIFLIIFLIISVLVSLYLSKKITGPITELKDVAERFGQGELNQRIKVDSGDELGELGKSFNIMADNLSRLESQLIAKNIDLQTNVDDLTEARKKIANEVVIIEKEKEKTVIERDKINAILHSIGDGVFVVDSDLKVILVNGVTTKISGYKTEEILGTKFNDKLKFVLEETGKLNDVFIKRAMETKTIQEMSNHTLLIDKNGNKIPVADSAAPLLDKNNNVIGCAIVFRDVTKERGIDKAKTEFISIASHQLRTPLTIINWHVEAILSEKTSNLSSVQLRYLNEVYVASKRMARLVNGLLSIAHIESGGLKIQLVNVYLDSLINEILYKLETFSKDHNCTIIFNKPLKRLPQIAIDKDLITEVIQNIITNAVRYSHGKKCVVDVSLKEQGSEYVISVTDQGIGIPAESQGRIFQRFFRADNARSKEPEGSGMGLYIAKMIVEASHGKLTFESPIGYKEVKGNKIGYGTVFHLNLPISSAESKK